VLSAYRGTRALNPERKPPVFLRRKIPMIAVLAVLVMVAAACGDDGSTAASPNAPADVDNEASGEEASAGELADGAFPLSIDHALGTAEIAEAPERVVTWGWGTTEAAIALGVTPVAMPFQAYGGDDEGVLRWVREELDAQGVEIPERLPDTQEAPIEAIAAANPDVILAVYSGLTQEECDLLSEIAPTVTYPNKPWATPWRKTIEIVGEALGKPEAAGQLLDDIDAQVAAAAEAHPEFDGKTIIQAADTPDTFYVYKEADPRVQFLTDLGFTNAPAVTELATDESSFYFTLSKERLGELESDALVAHAATQQAMDAFLSSDYAKQLPQLEAGTVAPLVGAPLVASVSPPNALSLTWGMNEYVAILSKAALAADDAGS
jgi:iron complex transport system substrate-binding protein